MFRLLYVFTLIVLLTGQVIATGCADTASAKDDAASILAEEGSGKISSAVMDELLAYDFSAGMSELGVYYLDGEDVPTGAGETLFMMMQLKLGHAVPERALTDKEKWTLGVKALPGGEYDSLSMLYTDIVSYHAAYGGLPNNGVELYPELAEATSLDEFNALSDVEKYMKYRHGINPITGKFYTSFIEDSWSPGGIFINFITDSATIKELYPDASIPINPAKVDLTKEDLTSVAEVWQITIYGEEDGTVLCKSELFT